MTNINLILLSILSGVLILLQSSLSGQLSKITGNPHLSSLTFYFFSFLAMSLYMAFFGRGIPEMIILKTIPKYLWVLGSVLSVLGLTIVYWLMPILGVSKVLSGIISGQILAGMIVSHFGFFDLPVIEINRFKLLGILFLFAGIILINGRFVSE